MFSKHFLPSPLGNEFMKSEKYADALESYSQAIKLDPKNAVYFCNR